MNGMLMDLRDRKEKNHGVRGAGSERRRGSDRLFHDGHVDGLGGGEVVDVLEDEPAEVERRVHEIVRREQQRDVVARGRAASFLFLRPIRSLLCQIIVADVVLWCWGRRGRGPRPLQFLFVFPVSSRS